MKCLATNRIEPTLYQAVLTGILVTSTNLDLKLFFFFFYVLLTVHLSIFILVVNQLHAQNLFYNKFISCVYMFRAPCTHRQEAKLYYAASGITPIGVMIPEIV